MKNWFNQVSQNIKDVLQYGSLSNRDAELEAAEKAKQEVYKINQEEEKKMREQGKTLVQFYQQQKKDELDRIKLQKEQVSLVKEIMKVLEIGQEKKEEGEEIAPSPTQTPSPTPTPTPEKIGQFIEALGLGTTWAGGDNKPAYPDNLVPYVNEAGQQYDIDPLILAAQQAQESGGYGYESRVGSSGEQGIAQITPKWHYKNAGIGDSNTYASKLANDPKYSIQEQARILAGYLKKQGNMYDALREYNAGGVLENSGTYADEILKRAGLEQMLPGRNI